MDDAQLPTSVEFGGTKGDIEPPTGVVARVQAVGADEREVHGSTQIVGRVLAARADDGEIAAEQVVAVEFVVAHVDGVVTDECDFPQRRSKNV